MVERLDQVVWMSGKFKKDHPFPLEDTTMQKMQHLPVRIYLCAWF